MALVPRSESRHRPARLRLLRLGWRDDGGLADGGRRAGRPREVHAGPPHRRRPGRRRTRTTRSPAAARAAGAQRADAGDQHPQGQGRPPRRRARHPAHRPDSPVPRQGPGTARGDPRLPPFGQAGRRLPRGRRPDRVLPCHRVRPHLPRAVEPAAAHRHGHLRHLPARHPRHDRRRARHAAHRRVQDRAEPAHREDLHPRAPRDGRVAQHRQLRAAGEGDCRRPQAQRGRGARAARPGPVPHRRGAARRPDRRRGLRGPAGGQGEDPARQGPRMDVDDLRPRGPPSRWASASGRASPSSTRRARSCRGAAATTR